MADSTDSTELSPWKLLVTLVSVMAAVLYSVLAWAMLSIWTELLRQADEQQEMLERLTRIEALHETQPEQHRK